MARPAAPKFLGLQRAGKRCGEAARLRHAPDRSRWHTGSADGAAPGQRTRSRRGQEVRTGAEYRAALRDGRKVVIMGGGEIEDVATHPATAAMVEQYVAWYDRHSDPAWTDTLISPSGTPWAFVLPKTGDEVRALGQAITKTIFLSAGNITHTPLYGHLIAMGVLVAAETRNAAPHHIANAEAYRQGIVRDQRFVTFCGGAAIIGQRLQPNPADRVSVKIVRETDKGMVVRGRLGMHTSPAYAEEVYVGHLTGLQVDGHPVGFIVPV